MSLRSLTIEVCLLVMIYSKGQPVTGITPKQMYGQFRGEAIYTAEVDVHFPNLTVGQTLSYVILGLIEVFTNRCIVSLPKLGLPVIHPMAFLRRTTPNICEMSSCLFLVSLTLSTRSLVMTSFEVLVVSNSLCEPKQKLTSIRW